MVRYNTLRVLLACDLAAFVYAGVGLLGDKTVPRASHLIAIITLLERAHTECKIAFLLVH
jgi:hypothetical protein